MSQKKKNIPQYRLDMGERLKQVRLLAGYKYMWQLACPELGEPKNKEEWTERTNRESEYRRRENGELMPKYEHLVFWSNQGFSVDWILTGKGQPRFTENEASYKIVGSTIHDILERLDVEDTVKKYILDEIGDMKAKNVQMMETLSELQEENRQLRKDKDDLHQLIEQMHKANQSRQ